MMRIETDANRGEVVIHVDDEGAETLAQAATDSLGGSKVFLGNPGAQLIVRHVDFYSPDERHDTASPQEWGRPEIPVD